MGKEIFGNCKLCGNYKKLTFEHVPPEKAFNSSAVKKFTGDEAMKLMTGDDDRMPWDLSGLSGKIQQRGSGDYYLCEECNNNTGSWYMTEYVRFSHKMEQFLGNALTNHPSKNLCSISLNDFYPLRVLKGIMTMFCDINHSCMGDDNLKEFLLNKESIAFDKDKYSLYLYLSKGPMWRIQGTSVFGSIYDGFICLSEISTLPIGLILVKDNKGAKIPGLCINDFANFKYDEKVKAEFVGLPILEVNSQIPADFRSKEEIIKCINESKLSMESLLNRKEDIK